MAINHLSSVHCLFRLNFICYRIVRSGLHSYLRICDESDRFIPFVRFVFNSHSHTHTHACDVFKLICKQTNKTNIQQKKSMKRRLNAHAQLQQHFMPISLLLRWIFGTLQMMWTILVVSIVRIFIPCVLYALLGCLMPYFHFCCCCFSAVAIAHIHLSCNK